MPLTDETTKTIFLHNPGCGGTFVKESYLRSHPGCPKTMLSGLPNILSNLDETYINAAVLPRFVPDYRDYRLLAFVRNPYNRFMSVFKTATDLNQQVRKIWERNGGDPKAVCRDLLGRDFMMQDNLLRNPLIPWLMPQSLFMSRGVTLLRYECQSDWNYLFGVLGIEKAETRIREDYDLDSYTKSMICELYYDDYELFRMYE